MRARRDLSFGQQYVSGCPFPSNRRKEQDYHSDRKPFRLFSNKCRADPAVIRAIFVEISDAKYRAADDAEHERHLMRSKGRYMMRSTGQHVL